MCRRRRPVQIVRLRPPQKLLSPIFNLHSQLESGACMDWYPLYNSLRIAAISTVAVFFLGILAAYYIAKLPRLAKGVLDVVLTLPLVLPPTVVGWLLLVLLGPNRPIGAWVQDHFGLRLVMTWWSAIFATVVVAFPLMYRTARGAFESFDHTLAEAAQTLGRSNTWIFWRVRMPVCRQGILAGTVLAFARALGEYGATSMIAGYTPGRTATISTTVYQLWRTNNDAEALRWVLVNIAISAVFLLAVNLLEAPHRRAGEGGGPGMGVTGAVKIRGGAYRGVTRPRAGVCGRAVPRRAARRGGAGKGGGR